MMRGGELLRVVHSIKRSPLIIVGLVIIGIIVSMAIFAPWIATHNPQARDWQNRLAPPSAEHLLGTDDTGADIFSKIVYGSSTTVRLVIVIVLLAATLGTSLGLLAAYFGGLVDMTIMRLADIFLSIPGLVLAMAVIVLMGSGIQNVMLAIVLVRWPAYARLARGQALAIKDLQFIEAARALGLPSRRIILRHILPNAIAPVVVYATMNMGGVTLMAASLSFLGLGAGPGAAEWGRMVAEGRDYFFQKPWLVTCPGAAIFFTVLGVNLLGDGIRDVLDPKMRRGHR